MRAPSVREARALNRSAQQLRAREARQAWPEELVELGGHRGMQLRLRAGLVLELGFGFAMNGQARWIRSSPHARWLEFFRGRGLAELPAVPRELVGDDALYELAEADALAGLHGLRRLEIHSMGERQAEGERALASSIASLSGLESLTLPVHRRATLPSLRSLGLRHLGLSQCAREDLQLLAGFDTLRSLQLGLLGPVTPNAEAALVEALALVEQLDSLRVDRGGSAPNWRTLLPRLSLRRLELLPGEDPLDIYGWRRAHAPLVELTQLEHLGVHHRFIPQGLFERLTALRSLELWGNQGPGRRSVVRTELGQLEQLHVGVALLPWLRAPRLAKLVLAGASELRPSVWSELERAGIGPKLRELDIYGLPAMSEPASKRVLAQLEQLTMVQAPSEADRVFIRELPQLRRLRVPSLDPAAHRALCEALPELLVETTRHWPRPRAQ